VKTKQWKVGIIGCGAILPGHVPFVQKLESVRELALCDVDEAKLHQASKAYEIERVWTDARDLLEAFQPDVVHILTPPQSHCELALRSMRAGAHVLVEKPMSVRVDEADEMLAVAEAQGVTLGVCHNFLFDPTIMQALALVHSGALGRVVVAETFSRVFLDKGIERYANTRWFHELPGGFFHEAAPHLVYLLEAFLGRLRVVGGKTKKTGGPLPSRADDLHAVFESDRGTGTFTISATARPYNKSMVLYGTKGTLWIDRVTNTLILHRVDGNSRWTRGLANIDKSWQYLAQTVVNAWRVFRGTSQTGHQVLLDRFYAHLEQGLPLPVSGWQGRSTVAVLEALWAHLGPLSSP